MDKKLPVAVETNVAAFNVVIAFLAVVAIVFLAVVLATLPGRLRTPPFDPLKLPTQVVHDRVDGVAGPAIHLGDDLHVTAVKCNTSGHEIGVAGHSVWRSVDPAGTVVEGAVGAAIRPGKPECVTTEYVNKLPEGVLARTKELIGEGKRAVWQLTGVDTPLGPDGVARGWATEPFTIVG